MADDPFKILQGWLDAIEHDLEIFGTTISGARVSELLFAVNQAETALSNFLGSLAQDIARSTIGSLQTSSTLISGATSGLLANLQTTLDGATATQAAFARDALTAVRDANIKALEDVRTVGDAVLEQSSIILAQVADLQTEIADVSLSLLRNASSSAILQIEQVASQAVQALNNAVDDSGGILSGIGSAFESAITSVINPVSDLIATGANQVKSIVDGLAVQTNVQAETQAFGFSSIAQVLSNTPGTLGAIIQAVIGGGMGDLIGSLEKLWPGILKNAGDASDNILFTMANSPIESHPQLRITFNRVRQAIEPLTRNDPISRTLYSVASMVILLVMQVQAIAAHETEEVTRALNTADPKTPIGGGDALEAFKRGLIDGETLDTELLSAGFNIDRRSTLLALQERLPEPERLLQWLYRGFIDDDQLRNGLKNIGYSEESQDFIRQAGDLVPPVGDLITMAVREVFSPEIAEKFGQFEGFPEVLAAEAQKHGLTVEWAERYWAAHWGLPSATQGFEMFHRRIISEEELHLLLRALDVMPFWRDRLVQMAYTPFTRVDLRRMYDLGVLDREGIISGYMDIGYPREKAELLADFADELQDDRAEREEGELKVATKATIVKGYTRGILSFDAALALLKEADYTDDAANLFLTLADLEEEFRRRDDTVDTIEIQFKAGIITFEQAQDRLNQAGLETSERDQALARLIREQARQVKTPSRADLDRFIKGGLITQEVYIDEMVKAGYTRQWSLRYLQTAIGQQPDLR